MRILPFVAVLLSSLVAACSGAAPEPGSAQSEEEIRVICPWIVMPVCGVAPGVAPWADAGPQYGTTYENGCWAEHAGATQIVEGACPTDGKECTPGEAPFCVEGTACGKFELPDGGTFPGSQCCEPGVDCKN
jgi:hypothetical protein